MNNQITTTRQTILDKRFNPLMGVPMAARHHLMRVLAWTWSLIFALSFLSMYAFGHAWLSQLLLIAGVFMTIAFVRRAASRRETRAPAPYLSRASKCVWQMDREA